MFGIHRTTVLAHLRRRRLRRPPALSEAEVLEATRQYQQGLSLRRSPAIWASARIRSPGAWQRRVIGQGRNGTRLGVASHVASS
jgi:hypothetical protein